jgi:glycosyltransferase involved in cell wall biosynthesis
VSTASQGRSIFVHDFAGHPFQIELSRELARRGHKVTHLYFAGDLGPKGLMRALPDDPRGLAIRPLTIAGVHAKYSYVRRWWQERGYARDLAALILRERPDIVISANTPIDPQARALAATQSYGGRFVFWLQDILSVGMTKILPPKYPMLGGLIAGHYRRLEGAALRASDGIVCISEDFIGHLKDWGVAESRITVIENWAPRDEIRPMAKDNSWSRKTGLTGKRILLYAGTLGLKHNPDLLRRLATSFADHPAVEVVVASEGLGTDWLKARKAAEALDRLTILPFQPYSDLPAMLASGDVLIAVIEEDAGEFSVPSKVLSYMAAGRAQLLSVPPVNLAARTVQRAGSGLVVEPGDGDGFVAAARRLIDDDGLRARCATAAAAYADVHFDISKIGDRFEAVIARMMPG